MTELSDREIEEAAREAGISPHELRLALSKKSQQSQGEGAIDQTSRMRPSSRGESVAYIESKLRQDPETAVLALRNALEHKSGCIGHMQNEFEADIFDEARRIVYRIRAEAAGDRNEGAFVRVDIDPTPAKARQLFLILALTASVALIGLGSLLLSTAGTALFSSLCATVMGGVGIFWSVAGRRRDCANALANANRAIIDVEQDDQPMQALEASRKD